MIRINSNIQKVLTALQAAQDSGLRAAAYVYRNEVVLRLRGGYTSGAFVTGLSANSVTISEPYVSDSGGRAIQIGTNVKYNLYWELGHQNLFTRKYERVEIWGPALRDTADAQAAAFHVAAQAEFARALP